MNKIEFNERPKIGEDMDKPAYPEELPRNPELRTERYWDGLETQVINHKLYRKLIVGSETATALLGLAGIGGWIATGEWKVAAGGWLLAMATGHFSREKMVEYNQKLKDVGHPYSPLGKVK